MRSAGTGALAILMLIVASTAPCLGFDERVALLHVYSNMQFIEEEGEWVGTQVAIVPYYDWERDSGPKVLWRAGVGYLEPPMLLDVVREGDLMKVVVPDSSQEHGEWTLWLEGDVLHGRGPRSLRFDMKQVPFR